MEEGKLESKVLFVRRVSYTRAGGRVMRYQAFAVAGNKNGMLG